MTHYLLIQIYRTTEKNKQPMHSAIPKTTIKFQNCYHPTITKTHIKMLM